MKPQTTVAMSAASMSAATMSAATMSAAGSRHLLVYPAPSSGHVIPLLDLTQRLLTGGFTITILITPTYRHLLQPLLSRHVASLQALVLPAPVDPSSGKHPLAAIVTAMRDHHSPEILRWFAAHPSPPVAIISDFFLGWTHNLACQLGVPRVVFSSSAAAALSVDFSLWGGEELLREAHSDNVITLRDVPSSPSFPRWQLSPLYRSFLAGDASLGILRDCVLANMESWGVVFNSFADLEQVYIDHMKMRFGSDRVWVVGPLVPSVDNSINRGGSSSVPSRSVLTWLDSQKTSSVVYVCFGSRMVLTNKEMDVLEAAFETSGVRFVWSVRGHVSEEFENRVSGRGLVIRGWAPQVAILGHPSVGSFLTHCGWNSVLEGLVTGVVMLTWPMAADQYMNAKLLVDQLGVGIRAWEGPEGTAPEPTELARVLAHSVDENIPQRWKAKELSDAAAAATAPGGSLDKGLDGFIVALSELKPQREGAP